MANDVSIIVSAELGDTLIKLDLAKHAINDLGDASLENAAKQDEAAVASSGFSDSLAGLNDVLTTSVPLLGGFSVPLVALPAIAGGAAIAVVALADAVGTLIAIVGDLVAPLTLVTGLLGLLGGAFFLAAKKALGMHEDGLGQAVSGLKKQFDDLTTTLVGRFMPVFQFLIHNASQALDFLNRIAKLPLDEAFKKLATQGVPAVTKFLEQVGHLLARPLRLAVEIAFGTGKGGNEISSAISGLWNQLTNFLFGYSVRHPVELRPGVFKIKTTTVDGIFQPFLDWFGRHDFTKQGIEIGHKILNGILNSKAAEKASKWLVKVLGDAIDTVESNIKQKIGANAVDFVVKHWKTILQAVEQLENPLKAIQGFIENKIGAAITTVVNHFGNVKSAIDTVKGLANDFWGILKKIAAFFSQTFSLNINWPSPPGWLTSLGGLLGGGGQSSSNPGAGTGRGAGSHGNVMVNHFHLAGSQSDAAFRRQVREIGRELGRQHHILAGGQ